MRTLSETPTSNPYPKPCADALCTGPHRQRHSALEATHLQMDGLYSQLPFKCYLPEVASVED
jgi:hypothetical protein